MTDSKHRRRSDPPEDRPLDANERRIAREVFARMKNAVDSGVSPDDLDGLARAVMGSEPSKGTDATAEATHPKPGQTA